MLPQDGVNSDPRLTTLEKAQTVRWLVQQQTQVGGFSGRTGKEADACYCFWCSASLEVSDRNSLTVPT
jgi:geranylgeranyl transferase type-1 subunit beta